MSRRCTFTTRNLIHRLFALALIFGLLPLFGLVAVALVLQAAWRGESPKIVFFEWRVSSGRPFRLYKFRVLMEGELKQYFTRHPMDSVRLLEREGSKLTPIGKIVRATHLDYLPELINVMRGDINLVGPRPYAVAELEAFPHRRIEARRVLRAGVIGPHQAATGPAFGGDASAQADTAYFLRIKDATLPCMLREDLEIFSNALRTGCRQVGRTLIQRASR